MDRRKKGQIWVETVIYTLIGLALIGIVLAIVTPKINTSRDKIIVEQSIASLSALDDKIKEVVDNGQGNVRKIPELTLKKGELTFDGETNTITLVLKDISRPYSEPGIAIEVGSVFVLSEVKNGKTIVYLTLNYTNILNLTVSKADVIKKYDPASVPYSFIISNEGGGAGVQFVVNIQEISDAGGTTPGNAPQCTTDANCNDNKECTNDVCNAGVCSHNNNLANCSGGQCNNGICVASCDLNNCPNNICFTSTCNGNSCGQTPVPFGETDAGCSNTCDGNGNCNIIFISSCENQINEDGMVYIVKNDLIINNGNSNICLNINANNVIIDGAGHSIIKNYEGGRGAGIQVIDKNNVMVKNITISQFGKGIEFNNVRNSSIFFSNITGNGESLYGPGGISISNGDNISIISNYITYNVAGIGTNIQNVFIEKNYICNNAGGNGQRINDLYCAGGGNFIGSNNVIGGGNGDFAGNGACSFSQLDKMNYDCNSQPPQTSPPLKKHSNNQ